MTKTTLSLSGTPYNSWYTCPRDNKRTCLLDPYSDTVGGKEVLMTTISVPLLVDGKAIGVVGVDIALDALPPLQERLAIITAPESAGVRNNTKPTKIDTPMTIFEAG